MRILLAHNSTYFPGQGGGDKSNRLLMEALAARGNSVTVVSRTAEHGADAHRQLLSELSNRDVAARVAEPGIVRFLLNGVEVNTSTGSPNFRAYFAKQIGAFRPDVVIASTDDSAQILLHAALDSPAAVVYLARATVALPFGPDCAFPSNEKTSAIRRADGVVGVSHYVANYIRQHAAIEAVHIPISLMDGGPWKQLGRFRNEFVTMINPCVLKGIDIFLAVADALPHVPFAGVRSWGTTQEDLEKLRARSNITVLDPVDDIDIIFSRTRALMVPSVWAEARARIVQEGMLRGIPVLASDTGGLGEAKLGVPYLLPVKQIETFHGTVNELMVPEAHSTSQDVGPWIEAVNRLTSDENHWTEIASASREAALEYAKLLTAEPFEAYLQKIVANAKPRVKNQPAVNTLTLDQKKLLALKMRQQRTWLVEVPGDVGPVQLICFPYAAAGPSVFRHWPGVTAVLYPGRESRVSEMAIDTPDAMLDALMEHVAPKLKGRFAFFGHSMGAGIAFELTRRIASAGGTTPEALFVSAARGPRFRTEVAPDPSDDALLETLTRLNPGRTERALQGILPLFKADTGLYRRYIYQPGPPLQIPIRAYGGSKDAGVQPEHLQRWREETTGPFSMRIFEGGHLFLEQHGPELLRDIREHSGH